MAGTPEHEAHKRVIDRTTAYVKALPAELFADAEFALAAVRLSLALIDAVRSAPANEEAPLG